MDKDKLKAIIESILFTMGESVTLSQLSEVLELEKREIKKVIEEMMEEYNSRESSGLMIIQLEDAYQMCSKSETYEYLIKIAKTPKKFVLTDALMETLAIVAYKQPVTKAELEAIRGVSCDHVISRLIEFDLIGEIGRLDAPGRPILFGTTEEFLRQFGLKSLDELPEFNPAQLADIQAEAEEEAQLKLDI